MDFDLEGRSYQMGPLHKHRLTKEILVHTARQAPAYYLAHAAASRRTPAPDATRHACADIDDDLRGQPAPAGHLMMVSEPRVLARRINPEREIGERRSAVAVCHVPAHQYHLAAGTTLTSCDG